MVTSSFCHGDISTVVWPDLPLWRGWLTRLWATDMIYIPTFRIRPVTWLHSVHEIPAPISCSPQLAIRNSQIFGQNLQALVIVKIQISICQKKALSELCWVITVSSCKLCWCEITCGYNISLNWTKRKIAGTRANYFWTKHSFRKEHPMGRRLMCIGCLYVAQAIPENELFLSKMSILQNRYPRLVLAEMHRVQLVTDLV